MPTVLICNCSCTQLYIADSVRTIGLSVQKIENLHWNLQKLQLNQNYINSKQNKALRKKT